MATKGRAKMSFMEDPLPSPPLPEDNSLNYKRGKNVNTK